MSVPPNRQMTRSSTEPSSVLRAPLPLRQLSVRRTMPGHRATNSLSLNVGGLRAPNAGEEAAARLGLSLSMSGLRGQPGNTEDEDTAVHTPQILTPQIFTRPMQPVVGHVAKGARTTIMAKHNNGASVELGPKTPWRNNTGARTEPHNIGNNGDAELARRAARVYKGGPQQIMPYLYLGGEQNVESKQLACLGITRVLNVAREVVIAPAIESRHLRWDHNETNVSKYFDECFAYIDEARTQHGGVLVHCQLGVSRSASLVIAYVMRTMRVGLDAAYEYVRLRAPCISPNISLVSQLSEYSRALGSELVISTRVEKAGGVPELSSASSENSSSDGSSVDCMCRRAVPHMPVLATAKPAVPRGDDAMSIHVVAHRHALLQAPVFEQGEE